MAEMKKKSHHKKTARQYPIITPPLNIDEDTQMGPCAAPLLNDDKEIQMEPTENVIFTKPSTTVRKTMTNKRKKSSEDFCYDVKLLQKVFNMEALKDMEGIFNTTELIDMQKCTVKTLKKPLIFKMNGGAPISCFHANSNALALFDMSMEDVNILNNLFKYILCKFNMKPTNNKPLLMDSSAMHFFPLDFTTTFWNRDGQLLLDLPHDVFTGNVALRFTGIKCYPIADGLAKKDVFHVKPLIAVEQVQVLNASSGDQTCMFNH